MTIGQRSPEPLHVRRGHGDIRTAQTRHVALGHRPPHRPQPPNRPQLHHPGSMGRAASPVVAHRGVRRQINANQEETERTITRI